MLIYAILLTLPGACLAQAEETDKLAKLFVDFTILQETCLFRPIYGRCKDNIQVYGYDFENNVCVGYLYSGCGGNTNRFNSVEECQKLCLVNIDNEIKVARDKDPFPKLDDEVT